jgi:osmoprotectant transport system substrate-binding protein
MQSNRVPRSVQLLGVVVMLAVLTLAGCGGGGSGGPGAGVKVVVASKNDPDGQLLASMYALLLQHAGYSVTTRIPLGQTNVLDAAIKSGQIDIYPEFTGTALALLKLPSTQDGHQAYTEVKNAYEQQFHITWLDPAYGLNDSYGLCTTQAIASQYHLQTLADLVPVAGQLVVAQQADAAQILAPVEAAYGIHFKGTAQYTEPLSFGAVQSGAAQVNECYTTDPAIVVNNFVLLKDPMNAFPIYNPAPLVRDPKLHESSAIATTLNPLEAHLTTAVIVGLIKQVAIDKKKPMDVARAFLQQQGLL